MSWFTKTADALAKAAEADELEKAALTSKERDALPDSDFIFPDTREYPYQDAGHARNALSRGAQNETGSRLATIKRKVHARYPEIGDGMEKSEFVYDSPVALWKDDKEHLVYTVFLQPEIPDSQGDRIGVEEIQKAAHRWMVESRKTDVQHSETPSDGIIPVETYLAPTDFQVKDPLGREHKVLKGSWIVVSKCMDPDVWSLVEKGEGGGSIGGIGYRTPD